MQTNRLLALIARDALLLGVTVALWNFTMHANQAPVFLSITTGLMTVVMGYLAHEWGHLLGALAGGSVVHLPPTPAAVFLFRFDTARNSSRQFLWMSAGGFISSAIIVAFLIVVLPRGLLASHIALGLTVLGVIATFILEVPSAWKVLRGGAMPHGAAFVSASVTGSSARDL